MAALVVLLSQQWWPTCSRCLAPHTRGPAAFYLVFLPWLSVLQCTQHRTARLFPQGPFPECQRPLEDHADAFRSPDVLLIFQILQDINSVALSHLAVPYKYYSCPLHPLPPLCGARPPLDTTGLCPPVLPQPIGPNTILVFSLNTCPNPGNSALISPFHDKIWCFCLYHLHTLLSNELNCPFNFLQKTLLTSVGKFNPPHQV